MKYQTECNQTTHVWSTLSHCKCGLTVWDYGKHKYTKTINVAGKPNALELLFESLPEHDKQRR